MSTRVFGVPIVDLVARDKTPTPIILQKCVAFLEKQAFFAVDVADYKKAGTLANIEAIKQAFDNGEDVNLEDKTTDAADVSGLIKEWLRSLPDPVISFHLQPALISTQGCSDSFLRIKYAGIVLSLLGSENKSVLLQLGELLQRVSSSDIILANELANEFGPLIFRPADKDWSNAIKVAAEWIQDPYSLLHVTHHSYIGIGKTNRRYKGTAHLECEEGDLLLWTKEGEEFWTCEIKGNSGLIPKSFIDVIKNFKVQATPSVEHGGTGVKGKREAFHTQLEGIRKLYDEEKSKRMALESRTNTMAQQLQQIQDELAKLRASNNRLLDKLH